MVGVAVYLATKLSDAALADLYESRLKPAVAACWLRATSRMRRHTVVRLDHWLDEFGILLRIEFLAGTGGENPPDRALAVEAIGKPRDTTPCTESRTG
jgi:hypothetical protein